MRWVTSPHGGWGDSVKSIDSSGTVWGVKDGKLWSGGIGYNNDAQMPEFKAVLWKPYENLFPQFVKSVVNVVSGNVQGLFVQAATDSATH